jgi:hypothetical protein
VQPAQRPAHRLAVGAHDIQGIQPRAVDRIQRPGHHAVHRQRRHRQRPALLRRPDDLRHRRLVVDRVHADAEDRPLAVVDHRAASHAQVSTFASWISRQMAGTS